MRYLLLSSVFLVALFLIKMTDPARAQVDAERTAGFRRVVKLSGQPSSPTSVYSGRILNSIKAVPIPSREYRMPVAVPDSSVDYSVQIVKPDPEFRSNMPVLIPDQAFIQIEQIEVHFPDSVLIDTSFAVPQLKNYTINPR